MSSLKFCVLLLSVVCTTGNVFALPSATTKITQKTAAKKEVSVTPTTIKPQKETTNNSSAEKSTSHTTESSTNTTEPTSDTSRSPTYTSGPTTNPTELTTDTDGTISDHTSYTMHMPTTDGTTEKTTKMEKRQKKLCISGGLDFSKEVVQRNWDSLTIREFYNMLTYTVDERIKQDKMTQEKQQQQVSEPRQQLNQSQYDSLMKEIQNYGKKLNDLLMRVDNLEKMRTPSDMGTTQENSTPFSSTETVTISTTIDTTTHAPTTQQTTTEHEQTSTHSTHFNTTENTSQTNQTSHSTNVENPGPISNKTGTNMSVPTSVVIELSNNSRRFFVNLLSNLTTLLLRSKHQPASLNITMTETATVSLPAGSHTITLPNHPDNYPDNQDLHLILVAAPTVRQLSLNCTVFDLEEHDDCSYDYLQVNDDTKYCGRNAPHHVTSSRQLTLHFHSDQSNNGTMVCHVTAVL